MNHEQVFDLLKNWKIDRVRNKLFPFYIMRYDFIKKYGYSNVIESLRYLVKNQMIEMGETSKDFYFNVELDDSPEKDFEIHILKQIGEL